MDAIGGGYNIYNAYFPIEFLATFAGSATRAPPSPLRCNHYEESHPRRTKHSMGMVYDVYNIRWDSNHH